MQEWHSHLNGAAEIQAIFFDLQKAFDTVPHVKLITNLIYLHTLLHGSQTTSTVDDNKLLFLVLHHPHIRCISRVSIRASIKILMVLQSYHFMAVSCNCLLMMY